MRLHHTLGRPGRPRRVNQGGEVIGRHLAPVFEGGWIALVVRLPARDQRLPADDPVVELDAFRVHDQECPQLWQLVANCLEFGQERRILDKGDDCIAVIGDVLNLLGRKRVVEADRDSTGVQHAEVCDEMLRPVARHDHRKLTRLEAEALQPRGDKTHLLPVLTPGQGVPGA